MRTEETDQRGARGGRGERGERRRRRAGTEEAEDLIFGNQLRLCHIVRNQGHTFCDRLTAVQIAGIEFTFGKPFLPLRLIPPLSEDTSISSWSQCSADTSVDTVLTMT